MKPPTADYIVIGAGIAGVSVAALLAAQGKVVLLERERRPAMHATGRSAAYFAPAYGNPVVREVTALSEGFFRSPPDGFAGSPLLRSRGALFVATAEQQSALRAMMADVTHLQHIEGASLPDVVPILDETVLAAGALDDSGGDLDVDVIVQAFLRRFRAAGGTAVFPAEVTALRRARGLWTVATGAGQWRAPVVINAGGAWADAVAGMAGLPPLGLTPMRRTAVLVDAPANVPVAAWPLVIDVEEQFYFKPDAGQLLISPADETPSAPCDAAPDEYDVALGIERVQRVARLDVARVNARWAGLRTFAPDKTFVVGFDPRAQGLLWLAGQGGYGVQSCPALADLACYLMTGERQIVATVPRAGLMEAMSPARFVGQGYQASLE